MRTLHIAVIVKNTPASFERDGKNVGYLSYPVPEFDWNYFAPGKNSTIDTLYYQRLGYDLIFHVDGGNWCTYQHDAIPVVYYSIDSTLSEVHHFAPRFEQARRADLILVDHDQLERFEATNKPVRRWNYCVNDRMFFPRNKTIDVNFQCGGTPERALTRNRLSELCLASGLSYRSGVRELSEYAETMGQSKIVVVQPRVARNRPHRLFDAMASGAMVMSYPFPSVSGDHLEADLNYIDLSKTSLDAVIDAVRDGAWEAMAQAGWRVAAKYHTWTVRAAELRALLGKEFGL